MKLRDSLAENDSIRLNAEAETWQEAVKIGVDMLVAAGVVEPRYYQAILDGVERFGPYFVIAPGLAMPHGRPEEGVLKTGFALVTLKKPLVFNHEDNDPVDILITLAAVDANAHQEVGIMQVVNLFEDEENFDRLRACTTAQQVLDLIDKTSAASDAALTD
ncbi:MAG: PTS ascorbate transporter subunit IIA [Ewingella sp.]|uniref:PTS ascorbate transporter subunit IIA n=1 Tax=Ewingella allii TaxID=3092550 RepID=UPI00264E4CF6|nr:PTS ascorbate transporter subunit IIA [Ewingella sp.]